MAENLEKKYGKQLLEKFYTDMVLIRRFEELAGQQYGLRKIGGFCHLYIGQEAVAVGSISALNLEKDYVVTAYRDHGHALACGMEPNAAMAELFGKETGCSKGKGGSMHLFDVERHMMGGNGIVGAHIPIATGIGLKLRNSKEDGVVVCSFGDGAIHQGSFHESLNLAKILGLPVIYICENNQYGMGTEFKRVSSVEDLSVRGTSYNIPGKQVNGMDVLDVYDTIQEAVKTVRETSEPLFFEIKTYRYRGHSMSDPAKYRTKEELENYKQQDPILILKKQLVTEEIFDDKTLESIDENAKHVSSESVQFAEESAEPSSDSLYSDVYA